MKKWKWLPVALTLAFASGCDRLPDSVGSWLKGGQGTPQSHGGPVTSHVSFVDALRAKQVQVDILGTAEQPFLQTPGTRLRLSGGPLTTSAELQSYEYENANAVKADADQITPDGNAKTTMIEWVEPPHFFLKERVMVLYVGKDEQVLKLLSELLGPQFAGR